MNPTDQIANDPVRAKATIRSMIALLIECRDALPAIPLHSARLHGISLSLADRIETALEPWEIKDEPQS